MGRRAVPELPAIEQTSDEELPVFGSEAEASAAPGSKPSSYVVREGNIPMVGNAATPMRARDRKSTRLNSSHTEQSRMPSSA